MRIIGVMTEDFQFFYRIVRALKQRDEPFISLSFEDPIPMNVSVMITTPGERAKVRFDKVAAHDDPEVAINMAKSLLKGRKFHVLTVGIDPGRTTGLALIGDGRLLLTDTVSWPEDARQMLCIMLQGIEYDEMVVRIGHGDPTVRNRIIKNIWGMADRVEIVDETCTTKNTERPDIDAAILISRLTGEPVPVPPHIDPTVGEVREVQRQSRLDSEGSLTISMDLARCVAKGEMRMGEAIQRQRCSEQ